MSDAREDSNLVESRDRETYQAMLNVLDDFDKDRLMASNTNAAIINILEDFDSDKKLITSTNRAVINILEDLDESKKETESLNRLLEQRVTRRTTELAQAEELFRLLVDGVKDYSIIVLDPSGKVISWNDGAERINGYSASEIVGNNFSCLYRTEDIANHQPERDLKIALDTGEYAYESSRVRKDGSVFLADVVITPLRDELGNLRGYGKVIRNITERKEAEARDREVMRQEILLKEIHHRVKNNLQIISSLLFLQSTLIDDPVMLDVLLESQGRVKSIALIHEKLYKAHDLEKLSFGEYINDLIIEMQHTYGTLNTKINFHMELEPIMISIDTAIPCGLIIHEVVSNALQHAFPEDVEGDIWVKLYKDNDKECNILTIFDNGVGLPEDYNIGKSVSLGLKLVEDLVIQIGGEYHLENKNGVKFTFVFNEVSYKERT